MISIHSRTNSYTFPSYFLLFIFFIPSFPSSLHHYFRLHFSIFTAYFSHFPPFHLPRFPPVAFILYSFFHHINPHLFSSSSISLPTFFPSFPSPFFQYIFQASIRRFLVYPLTIIFILHSYIIFSSSYSRFQPFSSQPNACVTPFSNLSTKFSSFISFPRIIHFFVFHPSHKPIVLLSLFIQNFYPKFDQKNIEKLSFFSHFFRHF
jgi:hypothetical protein